MVVKTKKRDLTSKSPSDSKVPPWEHKEENTDSKTPSDRKVSPCARKIKNVDGTLLRLLSLMVLVMENLLVYLKSKNGSLKYDSP